MSAVFTEDDIGKAVETDAGEALGVVVDVDPETAYVEPAPGAVDSTKAVLDWEESGEEAVPLTDAAVDRVTDDAIRLESDFDPESITPKATAEEERPAEGDEAGGSDADAADAEVDPDDVDFAPGEPVASNPTEPESDSEGTSGAGETGELDGGEPMMEDDEFYDDADDAARVDPDDEMEAPDADGDETTSPTEYDESEAAADAEGTAVEESESTDREDVDVDPDEVTEGDPEAEIDDDEDVGRRQGPDD